MLRLTLRAGQAARYIRGVGDFILAACAILTTLGALVTWLVSIRSAIGRLEARHEEADKANRHEHGEIRTDIRELRASIAPAWRQGE